MTLQEQVMAMPTREDELKTLGLQRLDDIKAIAMNAGVHGDDAAKLQDAIESLCDVVAQLVPIKLKV